MEERPYRVLADPHERDHWLLFDVERGERASVAAENRDDETTESDLTERVRSLNSGNRIVAALDWTTDPPRIEQLTVETRTHFQFIRTNELLFEAALDCWSAAQDAGEAMNAQVTRGTDSEPNGVVYTFADGPGADRFAEFREGRRPLDPLLNRIQGADPPYEVFVLDTGEPFVVVYIVFEPDGILAETVRNTYLGEKHGGLAIE